MATTINKQLASLADPTDEQVQAGSAVVRDAIRQTLESLGLESAASFEIKLKNGATVTISSDDNPALNTSMNEVASITPRQAGKAGVSGR